MADLEKENGDTRPFLHRWQYVIALLGVVTATAIGIVGWGGSDDRGVPDVDTVTAEQSATTAGGSPWTSRSTTSTTGRSSSPSSSTTASTAVRPFEHFVPGSTELPEVMAGAWEGMLNDEDDAQIVAAHLELQLAPPGSVDVGTISFPSFSCAGTVELGQVQSDHVLVRVTWDPGDDCIDGIVKLTYVDSNQITYDYQGGSTLSGPLNRLE